MSVKMCEEGEEEGVNAMTNKEGLPMTLEMKLALLFLIFSLF